MHSVRNRHLRAGSGRLLKVHSTKAEEKRREGSRYMVDEQGLLSCLCEKWGWGVGRGLRATNKRIWSSRLTSSVGANCVIYGYDGEVSKSRAKARMVSVMRDTSSNGFSGEEGWGMIDIEWQSTCRGLSEKDVVDTSNDKTE